MPIRIELPSDDSLSDEARALLSRLPPLNVFRMVANVPASLQAFVDLVSSIMIQAELDASKREIVVLRIAHLTGSRYEWVQHEKLARALGLSEPQLAAIAAAGPVSGLDEEGNLLCRVADEITHDVQLSEEALTLLLQRYGKRQTCELIFCISYFNMLSRFLESTRVELEDGDVIGSRTPAQLAKNTALAGRRD